MRRVSINNKAQSATIEPQFLPNLCSLQAVFLLAILGELLSLSLSVVSSGLQNIDWLDLGLRSFLLQWVLLLSVALLCPMRPWLARQNPLLAGMASYSLVLLVTLMCSVVGLLVLNRSIPDVWLLLDNLFLASIFGGIVLRYLYIQQQWNNQQKAELTARIQALQSRIRPHFLFNSLNSIASLVATDADTAERMIEDLASLFRASLSEPGLISLAEEVELCRQYAAIEQRRLGDRLHIDWQFSSEVLDQFDQIQFPSLLLQPLLENAIHHGIQPRPQGGKVELNMKLNNKTLLITMINPLLQAMPSPNSDNISHTLGNKMALDNIRHRLQAYYSDKADLQLDQQQDTFTVKLKIPV